MKILVTGASGYVGAKLFSDLRRDHEVVGTFHENNLFEELRELDVTNRESVLELFADVQPEVVLHTAAIASRSRCEANPQEAIATNARGTKHVVEAANRHGAIVIYVSTLGAIELDSFYGETKLVGEEYVEDTDAGYTVLRASMTYGYSPNTRNDRPFNRVLRTLRDGQPARYDDSWSFQPTYLKHLVEVVRHVLEAGALNRTVDIVIPAFKTKFEIVSDILEEFDQQVQREMEYQTRTKTGEYRATDPALPTWSYDEMIQAIVEELREVDVASV